MMKVAIRADASLDIGTGHVMRCLTLADVLRASGAECRFICRKHPGNLIEHIRQRGYQVHGLPLEAEAVVRSPGRLAHADWLGATEDQDAAGTVACLFGEVFDWLVVDHYALDASWAAQLRRHSRRLMVIDDLADRQHSCDLLVDQTYGRVPDVYRHRVPSACTLLCGTRYALLRPEFAALRLASVARRSDSSLRHLLVNMGGIDKHNDTSAVLHALADVALPVDCGITVVMGSSAPWLSDVCRVAASMPWPTEVKVGVSDMARLMTEADLAIGAAGATSWERCCLGLPTVMVVLAANQLGVAEGLKAAGAALVIDDSRQVAAELPRMLNSLLAVPDGLRALASAAGDLVDGLGASRILEQMLVTHENS